MAATLTQRLKADGWLEMLYVEDWRREPQHVILANFRTGESITHAELAKREAIEAAATPEKANIATRLYCTMRRTLLKLLPENYFFNRRYK